MEWKGYQFDPEVKDKLYQWVLRTMLSDEYGYPEEVITENCHKVWVWISLDKVSYFIKDIINLFKERYREMGITEGDTFEGHRIQDDIWTNGIELIQVNGLDMTAHMSLQNFYWELYFGITSYELYTMLKQAEVKLREMSDEKRKEIIG